MDLLMKLIALGCLIALSGCVSPKIPDDVPPAPPARKGEPYVAPSLGGEEEGEEEGFGSGGGFGGDTPTMEVEAGTLETAEEGAAAAKDEDGGTPDGKDEKDKPAKKKGDVKDADEKPAKPDEGGADAKEAPEN